MRRELLGAPPERVVVAPHGPGQELPAARHEGERRWFLYVGDAEPRKGLGALLDARPADAELVLAGGRPPPRRAGSACAASPR